MKSIVTLLFIFFLVVVTAPPVLASKPTPNDNPCQDCVLGPIELEIEKGAPRSFKYEFNADPQDDYTLVVEQLGQTALEALFQLNGKIVTQFKQPISGPGPHFLPVTLGSFNLFHVVIKGLEGGRIRIVLVRTSSLPPSRQGCGTRTEFFTHYPVDPGLLRSIAPLGNLNPPSHTLPTHHIYPGTVLTSPSDPTSSPSVVDVYAPGRVEVVAVIRNGPEDFDVQMQPCRDVRTYYLHVRTLDRVIADALRPDAWVCFAGTIDDGPCAQRISVVMNGGESVGTVPAPGSINFDWGLIDRRLPLLPFANPARYDFSSFDVSGFPPEVVALAPYIAPERLQQYCPGDYLVAALRTDAFWARFGSFDGATQRTVPPVCGEHEQDQPGTAQGNWFNGPMAHSFEEDRTTLALVHDNVNPAVPIFSVSRAFCDPLPGGGETCAWSPGGRDFTSGAAGVVNRDFADVVAGAVYCYDNLRRYPGGAPDTEIGRVLLEVFASTPGGVPDRLRIEPVAPTVAISCGAGPWTFSSGAREFQR